MGHLIFLHLRHDGARRVILRGQALQMAFLACFHECPDRFLSGNELARMLQISGITYSWSASAPIGSKVDPASIMVNGAVLDPAATYTVTANNFLAEGGDNFVVFRDATDKVYWGSDLDALVDYIEYLPQPFNASIEGRVTVLP